MLEYNYLSSPEKLTQHQSEYFANDLMKSDIKKIKKISVNNIKLEITDLINKNKDHE